MVSKVTMPLYRKRGFAEAHILSDWPIIVGERFAAVTLPEKLAFPKGEKQDGLLHMRVDGPLATELQHLEPQIVERINGYFGYHAVARLKLVQGPVPHLSKPVAAQPPPQADARTKRTISEMTTHNADEGLRTALTDLGCAVAAEQERRQDGGPSKKVKTATATAPENLAGDS
jgi:hypothetical protein